MKIKQIIYFILIIMGAIIMGYGPRFIVKEYALAIGVVFIMFGAYKTSTSWKEPEEKSKEL
ncbi:MAG: hypothetical protein ACN4ES_08505 [Cellulophaga baltica]